MMRLGVAAVLIGALWACGAVDGRAASSEPTAPTATPPATSDIKDKDTVKAKAAGDPTGKDRDSPAQKPGDGSTGKSDDKDGKSADKDEKSDMPKPALLAAFHKERRRWKEAGVTFSLHERSEVWANLVGGRRQGLSYNGLTTAKLDVDFAQAADWKGAQFHVDLFDIHGHGPSRSRVGNLQLVSNIEATPSIKLFGLWLDQSLFDERVSLRLGQEGADTEFMTTDYGGLFINASFGFPGMPAAVLPSGGPSYPLATPFVRAKLKASENLTLMAGLYNGDPAPPGPGDPQIRDRNGTAFRLDDHALAFGEASYTPDPKAPEALPTTYKLGAWYASNRFADQRFDSAGLSLADPASSGRPRSHTGDWAVYGVIDQMVWQRPGSKDHGVGVFFRAVGGPSDRNLSNLSVVAGVDWRAPFEERPDDAFGLAVAYLGISPRAQGFSRDLIAFGGAVSTYAGHETVVEATYQMTVTDWLILQPDIQLVINPGAAIPSTTNRAAPLPNAVILGMRATFRL